MLAGIDNLAAQQAQGFVICTPDVKLGPAIVAKAQAAGLKVMSVDDRFVGPDGNPIEEVHHMGISAFNIGKAVGQALVEEAAARGWDLKEVGFLRMSYDQLPTIKERTDGATEVLVNAGLPEANIFDSPMKVLDIEASMNAANITLTKHPDVKLWVVAGGNDSSAIGAVRALEGQKVPLENAIAVKSTELKLLRRVRETRNQPPDRLCDSAGCKTAWLARRKTCSNGLKTESNLKKPSGPAKGQLITRENYKVMELN